MRYILGSLIFCFLFSSCQKENDTSDSTPPATSEPATTLSFKINGTLVQINGSLSQNSKEGAIIRKEQVVGNGNQNPSDNENGDELSNTNYSFSLLATKNYSYSDDGEPLVDIEFRTSSLTGPATFENSAGVRIASIYYPSAGGGVFCGRCTPNPRTSFKLSITNISNGYADGTFSGVLDDEGYPTPIITQITDGEFKNVKILQ